MRSNGVTEFSDSLDTQPARDYCLPMAAKSITYTATAPDGTAYELTAPTTWDEVWFCFRSRPDGGYFTTRHRTAHAARFGAAPNKIIGSWPRSFTQGTRN